MNKKQRKAREIITWLTLNDIPVPQKLLEIGADFDFVEAIMGKSKKECLDDILLKNGSNQLN